MLELIDDSWRIYLFHFNSIAENIFLFRQNIEQNFDEKKLEFTDFCLNFILPLRVFKYFYEVSK